jgi:hypothetical protein
MTMRLFTRGALLILAAGLATVDRGRAEAPSASKQAVQRDRVVAGSAKDFMEVRHVVLRGSNEAIGRALATLSHERFGSQPAPSSDPFRTRVQRRYFQRNYPIHFDRMRGVAAAFGRRVDDDAFNFSGLDFTQLQAGCSVFYCPPGTTATGRGIFSRDYDFTTGTFQGTKPPPGKLGVTARPFVLEMYPDRGYASLAVCAYDLLGGVLDGINSEGLTVALLADDELMSGGRMEPAGDTGVGLGVLQMLRMLLDSCADVPQAKEALLLSKQYYEFIPVHYIIADRHGNAFVWEYSHAHNREYIVENPGKVLVTTNFSLHRRLDGKGPPSAEGARQVCPRYCALMEKVAGQADKLTLDAVKEAHRTVDATRPAPKDGSRPPHRTLWHALYFPEERKVQINFYLRDEADPDHPDRPRIVRSDYREFALEQSRSATDAAPARRGGN